MKSAVIHGNKVEVHFEAPHVTLYWDELNGWVGTYWTKSSLGDDWRGSRPCKRCSIEGSP